MGASSAGWCDGVRRARAPRGRAGTLVGVFGAGLLLLPGCGGDGPSDPNQPPTAAISSPTEGASFGEGESISFQGTASDPEDGQLDATSVVWRSSQDGQIGTGLSFSRADLSGGDHVIRLTATDSDGASDADSVGITVQGAGAPQEANLTVASLFAVPRGVLRDSTTSAVGTIRNVGMTPTGAFDWELRVDGSVVATGRIDSVAAEDSVKLPAQEGLGPFAAGTHQFVLEVDVGDEVSEASETDNTGQARLESFTEGFGIEVDFLGGLSSDERTIVLDAVDRWETIIRSELADLQLSQNDSLNLENCAEGGGTRTEPIDDMLVLVRADSIDGPVAQDSGRVVAQAGPCFVRVQSGDPGRPPHTIVGALIIDEDDKERLRNEGRFADVVLHELAHVFGFGFWTPLSPDIDRFQLLVDADTQNPSFIGRAAIEAFGEVGGDRTDGVPVEATGGMGTALGHWRESVFDNELMTGFINQGPNPLSVVSIASLADQFYAVDRSRADFFVLPPSSTLGALRAGGAGLHLGDHVRRGPIFGVDEFGNVRRLHPMDPTDPFRAR